jgi:hypothetical protein
MLRTGWFSSVYVKSVDTHRLKALLGARDGRKIGVMLSGTLSLLVMCHPALSRSSTAWAP